MKKYIVIFVLLISMILINLNSCKKNEEIANNAIEHPLDISKYGEIHNEVLGMFYKNGHSKSTLSFQEKVNLIDKYLAQVVEGIDEGMFTSIVNSNQLGIKTYLEQISNSESDIQTGYYIINDIYEKEQITENEKIYCTSIISAYEEYPFDFPELLNKLYEIEQDILADASLSLSEKKNLQKVFSITVASIEFWEEAPLILPNKGIPWYVKDCTGAIAGVQTGLVGYATTLFGPWGGAAALLGSAIFASAI